MKSKLLIIGALCVITLTANAQTEKGKSFINGSIGYTSLKSGNSQNNENSFASYGDTTRKFSIMPRFGHFFSRNLAIGIGIGYNNDKSRVSNTSVNGSTIITSFQEAKQHSYYFGPFIRYYVDIVEKFKFFGQMNTAIGFGEGDHSGDYKYYNLSSSNPNPISYSTSNSNYKFTSYDASVNPGFAFFPSKRWAIEFSFPLLSYNKIKPKDQNPANINISTTESFSFATDSFNPSIGFNFHF